MTAPSPRPESPELASEPRERPSRGLAILTLVVVAVCAVWGLLRSSVWDPAELETAEFARRVARQLFGAALPGPDVETVPTQGELGRGELPVLAVAL